MANPVYSLIKDLEGNGPCVAPYPYHGYIVAMVTPCPFADGDVVPGSVITNYSDLTYGQGSIKATTSEYVANVIISFRFKHNGGNRIIRFSKSANSKLRDAQYSLKVNNRIDYVLYQLDYGDNVLVPPYYRYQMRMELWVHQLSEHPKDYEEIWVKAEIL